MSKEQTELLADYFTEKPETTTTEILEILFMSNTHMIEENKKQPRTTEITSDAGIALSVHFSMLTVTPD